MILDVTNPVHLWCLQYVYQPRIQAALDIFKSGWNNHRMRTEKGHTPRQMYVQAVIQQMGQGHCGIDDLFYQPPSDDIADEQLSEYGADWNGPIPATDARNEAPPSSCPLSQARFQELQNHVDHLVDSYIYLTGCQICCYWSRLNRVLAFGDFQNNY